MPSRAEPEKQKPIFIEDQFSSYAAMREFIKRMTAPFHGHLAIARVM